MWVPMPDQHPKKLKYVVIEKRKTRPPVHRVRVPGIKHSIRLTKEPWSGDYYEEYGQALQKLKAGHKPLDWRKKANNHYLGEVLTAFEDSNHFKGLKKNTRKTYKTTMNLIRKKLGGVHCNDLKLSQIDVAMEDLNAHTANSFLSTLRRIIYWAHRRDIMNRDPTINMKGKKRDREGFPPWTQKDIKTFQEHWPVGTRERLAFDLLNYTGLRVSDIIELGAHHIKDGFIKKTCRKNKAEIELPLHPDLQASINATKTGTEAFLKIAKFDRPFKDSNYFGAFFRKACQQAGISQDADTRALTAHGLRKTAAIRAIEDGATPHQVMAALGWNDRTMADHYTWKKDRRAMGREFGHKIMPKPSQD